MSAPFLPDDPSETVASSTRGFARAHADLVRLVPDPLHLVARHRHPDRVVGLVSGGGSGHEPLHAGFLGEGMLDAVAPGQVFASPHNRQVLEASRAAAGPEGVVHVVKNYTGDRINFGIAAERLARDGVPVRRVLVDDDVATESDRTATGRRGTGATVVVEKILGAAADQGRGLDELAGLGGSVAALSRSLAVASRAQTAPQTGAPAFDLTAGEVEYGVGIHGERAARTIERPSRSSLLDRMVDDLWRHLPEGPDELLVFVGGLGATTALELYSVFDDVADRLERRGRRVTASLVGTYVPALDMSGFSVTITRLRPGWVDLWQAPSWTPGFPRTVGSPLTDQEPPDRPGASRRPGVPAMAGAPTTEAAR